MYLAIVIALLLLFGLPVVLDYRRKKRISIVAIIVALVLVLLFSWLLRPMVIHAYPVHFVPPSVS